VENQPTPIESHGLDATALRDSREN